MASHELDKTPFESQELAKIRDFKGQDILSARQFDRENLACVFEKAGEMEELVKEGRGNEPLRGLILATLFYEASTRTRLSFEAAMHRLGGRVISESSVQFSSAIKGERLEDTIRVVESYADIIALRQPKAGEAKRAAEFAQVPIINAGDGEGEHPTQALLDLYTIQKECGKIDGLTVTMLGDLKYGRTVHSLAHLLSLYKVKLNLVSPTFLKMPQELLNEIESKGVEITETNSLAGLNPNYDILYVTRVQKERIKDKEEPAIASHLHNFDHIYALTPEIVSQTNVPILHPLPRVNEIPLEIDKLPQAAYFRQVKNGLYIRMALLSLILKGNKVDSATTRTTP